MSLLGRGEWREYVAGLQENLNLERAIRERATRECPFCASTQFDEKRDKAGLCEDCQYEVGVRIVAPLTPPGQE